jgi:hypothetical protein
MPPRMNASVGVSLLMAVSILACRTPMVRPTATSAVRLSELWERPGDLASRDLYYGRWGTAHAPDPSVTYTFVAPKLTGTNPGMTVRDPQGRKWSVKQRDTGRGAEGPAEVTLARVLEAVGYHQPPVYFLHGFKVRGGGGPLRVEGGGRFRLHLSELDSRGDWSWQENPFVGMTPYQGLLAILLMFNSSDLKNSNNTRYRYQPAGEDPQTWYVVRDLGMALGNTGKLDPLRSDVAAFERTRFTLGIRDGFVRFAYRGRHQEIGAGRLTAADVRWASELLGGLGDAQWRDAFRAGGFSPGESDRFIRVIRDRIREGRTLGTRARAGS